MPNYEAAIPGLLATGVIGVILLCIFKLWDAFRAISRRFKTNRAAKRAEGARSDLLS